MEDIGFRIMFSRCLDGIAYLSLCTACFKDITIAGARWYQHCIRGAEGEQHATREDARYVDDNNFGGMRGVGRVIEHIVFCYRPHRKTRKVGFTDP